MRSVSFVDYLELEFSGNILERAITLGDVSNDGGSQLVVANIAGDLAIFKGCDSTPWRKYRKLGMISCIVIGDLCNIGRNILFSLTSEGWCHLMSFHDSDKGNEGADVISTFHQLFPTNGKIATMGDVDGDGLPELIIASTDRVIRVFKWIKDKPEKDRTVEPDKPVLVKQNSKSSLKRFLSKDNENEKVRETETENVHQDVSDIFKGKFVCVKRWKLAGQVESLSVIEGYLKTSPFILVSQPGAGYIYLTCDEESVRENLQMQTNKLIPKSSVISFTECYSNEENIRVQYRILRRTDTSTMPTHAIYWYSRPVKKLATTTKFIAMCTLNGSLLVVQDDKMHLTINLMKNFFTVQKIDITGDGNEEVVFCSWDGETFIMDQYDNIINFKLGQDISAFTTGYYSYSDRECNPCFVYVTFNNRIRLYWNVRLRSLATRNFNDMLVCQLDTFSMDPEFRAFIESEDGSLDNDRMKQLTSWCLYDSCADKKKHSTSDSDEDITDAK